jgi:hypothetical protein
MNLFDHQKKQLLEMCNKLMDDNCYYTQFRFLPTLKVGRFKRQIFDDLNFIQWIDQSTGLTFKQHWFEFCYTKLADKIFKKIEDKIQFLTDTWTGSPVDYLYEEFLKLKL